MAFKLCQEGNREPLFQRIVFANGLLESKCLCVQTIPNASPPRKEEVARWFTCPTHTQTLL
jgi:hypothetical protein